MIIVLVTITNYGLEALVGTPPKTSIPIPFANQADADEYINRVIDYYSSVENIELQIEII